MASSRYRKMQNSQIFRGLGPLYPHQGKAPPDPQLQKAMTLGHCLSCLWHDKTQLKTPLQLSKGYKTVSVLICSLQNVFGQFTKPWHFFKSPRCKIGALRRIFTYLPENICGPQGVITTLTKVKIL